MTGLYVVIPAYNEEKFIGRVVREAKVRASVVVVVDDGSADRTFSAAEENGAEALRHPINRGQGAALRTGIRYALEKGAEIIVTYDADGQFNAEDIPRMAEPVRTGQAEAVLGSRFLEIVSDIPPVRKAVLRAAVLFTRLVSGLRVSDTHNGFRAFSRKAAGQIEIREDEWAHASEIIDEISKKKIKFIELPVKVNYTEYSKSKGQPSSNSFKIAFRVFWSKFMR